MDREHAPDPPPNICHLDVNKCYNPDETTYLPSKIGLLFSLTAHSPIMKFMGDYPSKQAHSSIEVTDQIFVPAIQEEVLRDEIYCQIMKQLTENRNRYYLGANFLLLHSQPLVQGASGTPAAFVMQWGQGEG